MIQMAPQPPTRGPYTHLGPDQLFCCDLPPGGRMAYLLSVQSQAAQKVTLSSDYITIQPTDGQLVFS
jgi:hypothetical protein